MVIKKPNDAKAHRMAAANDLNSMPLPKLAIAKRALKSAFRRQLVTPKTIDVDGIIGRPEAFNVYVHSTMQIVGEPYDYTLTFQVDENGNINELDFDGPNLSFKCFVNTIARIRGIVGSETNLERFAHRIDTSESDVVAFLKRTKELSDRCIIFSRLIHAVVTDYAKMIPTLKLKVKQ